MERLIHSSTSVHGEQKESRASEVGGWFGPVDHEHDRMVAFVHRVLQRPGRPLADPLRTALETSFQADLSQVRVHHDGESTGALGARAFTIGQDIVFDGVERRSPDRANLLLHEVAHTLQQPHRRWKFNESLSLRQPPALESQARQSAANILSGSPPPALASTDLGIQREDGRGRAPAPARRAGRASGAGARAARGRSNDVIGIRLNHREAAGLGRFDAILYRNCDLMIQLRMNFTWRGVWPNEGEKRSWQRRFISSIEAGWSRKFDLEATGTCSSPCRRVSPFVRIYAPHTAPHVNVEVTYTNRYIQSRAGYGGANLDSRDLTPTVKRRGTQPQVPAVHEFGHLIGRHDQNRPGGICAPGYPLQGVMCYGNTVQASDYQPFANALQQMTRCTYRAVPRRRTRPSPIPLREDFIPEMMRSLEDLPL